MKIFPDIFHLVSLPTEGPLWVLFDWSAISLDIQLRSVPYFTTNKFKTPSGLSDLGAHLSIPQAHPTRRASLPPRTKHLPPRSPLKMSYGALRTRHRPVRCTLYCSCAPATYVPEHFAELREVATPPQSE